MINVSNPPTFEGPVCPLPLVHNDVIVMGHGSGGRMTQELVDRVFKKYLSNNSISIDFLFSIKY